MIGDQIQTNQDGTLTISCKIPATWLPLLNMICAIKGANMNDLMKMCIRFLIETAKVTTDPSPDMKALLHMMKVDANWSKMFNYVKSGDMDIAQCILILQQAKDGKPREGFGLAMFNKPFVGECTQTLCVDEIAERVLEVAMGSSTYWDMRQIVKHFESQSIRETLVKMVDAQTIMDLDAADNEELPGYGDMHDFGRAIEYGNKSKRKPHRTPDSLANSQQRIIFDDFDRDLADMEVKDWEGLHHDS